MSKICIVGLQWGDEGKGKFVDYFAKDAKVIVRFQGGNNAGHTIVVNGVSYKLSVLPSSILHKKKVAFIGPGVVLDMEALFSEIEKVKSAGIDVSSETLKIAENATVIIPLYKKLDALLENLKGERKIGTTGRGIAIAYQDQVGRRSIRVCDLYDPETLNSQIESILGFYSPLIQKYSPEFSSNAAKQETIEYCLKYKGLLKDYLVPPNFLHSFKHESILFEGAQGAMLDVSFGTYPFVTSSNTLASEGFIGSGYPGSFDRVFGTVKAYCTRVGSGPFPSEDHGKTATLLRERGVEFGTVTGRERRCGYLDLVALKYASELSGVTDIILTKIDVLNGLETIKICTSYELDGKNISHFPTSTVAQSKIKPVYTEFKGWEENYDFTNFDHLPQNLKKYIGFIQDFMGIPVSILSFGAEREATLDLRTL